MRILDCREARGSLWFLKNKRSRVIRESPKCSGHRGWLWGGPGRGVSSAVPCPWDGMDGGSSPWLWVGRAGGKDLTVMEKCAVPGIPNSRMSPKGCPTEQSPDASFPGRGSRGWAAAAPGRQLLEAFCYRWLFLIKKKMIFIVFKELIWFSICIAVIQKSSAVGCLWCLSSSRAESDAEAPECGAGSLFCTAFLLKASFI